MLNITPHTKQVTPPNCGVFLFINIISIVIHIQNVKPRLDGIGWTNLTKLLDNLTMNLNKNYFLPLTTLLIHVFFGINFTYAACEKEVSDYCRHSDSGGNSDFYSGCVKAQENTIEEEVERVLREEESKTENKTAARAEARRRLIDSINYAERGMGEKNPRFRIISVMQFCQLKESLNLFDSRNQGKPAYSETVSNQSSSSSASSQSNNQANRQSANNQSSSNAYNQSNHNTSNQPQSNAQSNASNGNSNTGLSMKPEQEVLVNTASQKYASESAAFEASHKGLKRTHNKEDEASRCLVTENRKIKNTCDYRVEYTFCAYKPNLKAFSAAFEMAAAFDCEQRKFGSAGISAKRVDAGTYTAEAVYVFGCKDPSLPRGVTYERGRGLSGRCAE